MPRKAAEKGPAPGQSAALLDGRIVPRRFPTRAAACLTTYPAIGEGIREPRVRGELRAGRPATRPGARTRPAATGKGTRMSPPPLQVGSLVFAKRGSGVCAPGERGVCYEVYQLGGRPGYSILFQGGRYDGFSPDEVETFLEVTGQ